VLLPVRHSHRARLLLLQSPQLQLLLRQQGLLQLAALMQPAHEAHPRVPRAAPAWVLLPAGCRPEWAAGATGALSLLLLMLLLMEVAGSRAGDGPAQPPAAAPAAAVAPAQPQSLLQPTLPVCYCCLL
jgi:hypothetical protein